MQICNTVRTTCNNKDMPQLLNYHEIATKRGHHKPVQVAIYTHAIIDCIIIIIIIFNTCPDGGVQVVAVKNLYLFGMVHFLQLRVPAYHLGNACFSYTGGPGSTR